MFKNKKARLGPKRMPSSFRLCCSMWGPEPCHPHLGGKQGRDQPDFRKEAVTSGEKELLREEHTLSGGRRFQQALQGLSAGAEGGSERQTGADHPLEILRASLGTQRVGRLKQRLGHVTFLLKFCV